VFLKLDVQKNEHYWVAETYGDSAHESKVFWQPPLIIGKYQKGLAMF